MNSKRRLVINSYEEFENHLRECIQWDTNEVGQYDIVGITNLLSAILDNLNTNVHQSNYESLREILSKQNIEFLRKLTNEN